MDASFSEEKGVVILNRGKKIILDYTETNEGNAYDTSNGIYTVKNDGEYDLYLRFTTSVKTVPFNLVIDDKVQDKEVWNTDISSPDPARKGTFVHALLSNAIELKTGQRWWLTNKGKKTKYFDMHAIFRKFAE